MLAALVIIGTGKEVSAAQWGIRFVALSVPRTVRPGTLSPQRSAEVIQKIQESCSVCTSCSLEWQVPHRCWGSQQSEQRGLGLQSIQPQGTLPPAQPGKDRMGKDMVAGHANCVSLLEPEEPERVWEHVYSGLGWSGHLGETLEYLLHLGSPQVHPCPKPPSPCSPKPCLALPSSLGHLNKCRKNSYKM